MKIKKALTLFALCLFVVFAISFSVSSASSTYTLFCDDAPWEYESDYPARLYNNTVYLPITMFDGISGVATGESVIIKNLIIVYGESFITFDITEEKLITDKNESMSCPTYLFDGDVRYVPAELVCSALGLNFEAKGDCYRISGADATESFDSLIEKYNSSHTGETETAKDPEPEPISDCTVYIVADCCDETSEMLKYINSIGSSITVCLDEEYVRNNPSAIHTLMAGNNGFCILSEISDTDKFISGANSVNNALCECIYKKTHLVMLDGGIKISELTEGFINAVADGSYALFECDFTVSDKNGLNRVYTYIKSHNSVSVRFTSDEVSYGCLYQLLDYIQDNEKIKVSTVNDANFNTIGE